MEKKKGNPYWLEGEQLENPYWLFGSKLSDVVKMSYAASAYSTDFRSVPEEHKVFISEALADFQYIGVRDAETFNFVKEQTEGKEIHRNCDPTFLLPKSGQTGFARKTLRKNLVSSRRPLISFMTASMPYIQEIKQHLGRSYTYIHYSHRDRYKDIFDRDTRLLLKLAPTEWYHVYSLCKLNFSHYFHGTLLGLRNSVPTISVDKTNFPYPYTGKNEQVMTDLGLKDYLFFQKSLSQKEEKDRLFHQVDFAIKNYETVRVRVEAAANAEKERAESFFLALKQHL